MTLSPAVYVLLCYKTGHARQGRQVFCILVDLALNWKTIVHRSHGSLCSAESWTFGKRNCTFELQFYMHAIECDEKSSFRGFRWRVSTQPVSASHHQLMH